MPRRLPSAAALLFTSGLCALVYETVWLRELRLIFGASTASSAAVLAIFLGGLGAGAALFGPRVDRSRNPLAMYAFLELGVAFAAAATPLLLFVFRAAYLAMGGSFAMGDVLATIVRLVFSVLILGLPTTLMGGTLPAMSRAIESGSDEGRRGVAAVYGANTLGAVTGTILSTFFLLERFGDRKTLWVAALVNALVGLVALAISNALRAPQGKSRALRDEIEDVGGDAKAAALPPQSKSKTRFVYGAAAVAGFAFLLMELVWYRMLAPLLGGTTYTFGLILAAALAGIGLGSLAYVFVRRTRAGAGAFAVCCAFEALFIAVPLALGDRVALLALLLRPLGSIGFSGFVLAWSVVAALVVFPAAFISGIQFPLLISLLGEGRPGVGRDVGNAYAWNTGGSIVGSLAGGFGMLPLLTAPGVWRTVVVVLAATAFASLMFGRRGAGSVLTAIGVSALAVALLFATGPTAFWRHTPIGAGRADPGKTTRNRLIDLGHARRRTTAWEAEGIESSVSVSEDDGYAFIVNGKGDGHSRLDAGTQVMSAMLPVLLHPHPRTAAVVGLGTGSTAGWLAAVPSMERVDVVEIEPAIDHVAAMCTPVNHDVLHNAKAHVLHGDGREFLLGRGQRFDIISSEPSNPYRAGISSLFTVEFYRACLSRLNRDGLFVQFLQAYEVDATTVRTIYASITAVFPHVETWQSQSGDLLLVAAAEPPRYDEQSLAAKLATEPLHTAVHNVWIDSDVSSVLAHYICGNATARVLAVGAAKNTDDRSIVEYAFARTLGTSDSFHAADLRNYARSQADDLPQFARPRAGEIELRRLSMNMPHDRLPDLHPYLSEEMRLRGIAQSRYMEGAYADVWTLWQAQRLKPQTMLETITLAEALAERGDESVLPMLAALQRESPLEALVLAARLRWRQGRTAEGAEMMARAFEAYRTNPWPVPIVMRRGLMFINEIARQREFTAVGPRIMAALNQPFAVHMFDELRRSTLLNVAEQLSRDACSDAEMDIIRSYEPNVPWQEHFLELRARCYRRRGDGRAGEAERDLRVYRKSEPAGL